MNTALIDNQTEGTPVVAVQGVVVQRRSRHERKMARNEAFARLKACREEWERRHPITSGKVKITEYVPSGMGTRHNVGAEARPPVQPQTEKGKYDE